MATFRSQFAAASKTNQAVRVLEASARAQASSIAMLASVRSPNRVRIENDLIGVVTDVYRASAAMAVAHLSAQISVPRWKPRTVNAETLTTDYLSGLVSDIRKNLKSFWLGDLPDVDSLRSRVEHSAGVAAARGYTDALILASTELSKEHGFILRKVWRANWVDHTPCPLCAELDGTSVAMAASYESSSTLAIYGDLVGPPRHPRCMCWLVILVEGLENYNDKDDETGPEQEPTSVTTEDVQKMPAGFYNRIVRWLRTLKRRLRGGSGG